MAMLNAGARPPQTQLQIAIAVDMARRRAFARSQPR
jgi:hypothetical protein